MFRRFWLWLTGNFGFLATKGFIITNFIGLVTGLCFCYFLVRGDGLSLITIGESIFVGVVTIFVGHFVGIFILDDNWPGLHFDSPLKEVNTPEAAKEEEPKRINPYKDDIPAVQTAWEIMQDARDAANGVKRGNKIDN